MRLGRNKLKGGTRVRIICIKEPMAEIVCVHNSVMHRASVMDLVDGALNPQTTAVELGYLGATVTDHPCPNVSKLLSPTLNLIFLTTTSLCLCLLNHLPSTKRSTCKLLLTV
ncbi:NAD-dependent epimerase/dehydratase terH [Fusarium oxysporum f. sp. albedinis]|nr:NAD-dependent epimerase/dehydratase terH [Fusarium oxysporum f. sp. albedinis]